MCGRKLVTILGIVCSLSIAAPERAQAAEALSRVAKITVKSGYIDSHFAVSPDGKILAYVHVTEGAKSRATLHIVNLTGAQKSLAQVNISAYTRQPLELFFTADSAKVAVVARSRVASAKPPKIANFYKLDGKRGGAIRNFHQLIARVVGGKPEYVAYYEQMMAMSTAHQVTLYDGKTLRRKKGIRLLSTHNGEVRLPKMTIGFWAPDYSYLMAKVVGAYDRKNDVKLPDKERKYNPFTRKFEGDVGKEIANIRAWNAFRKIRYAHPAVPNLLRITGEQKNFKFELITVDNKRHALKGETPALKKFNFKTLAQQRDPAGKILLYGLSIDPQWPTLFAQKRNAPEIFHLFKMDLATRDTVTVGTIACKGQVLNWHRGGDRLAVMRLHKFWRLGHHALEVYRLPAL